MAKHIGFAVFMVFAILASIFMVLDIRATFSSTIINSALNLAPQTISLFALTYISALSYPKKRFASVTPDRLRKHCFQAGQFDSCLGRMVQAQL